MSDDLVKRLREPDWHDPKCPFLKHCYCGDDENPSPHDKRQHPDALEAADRIEALAAALAKADELAGAWEKYQGLFHADDEDLVDAAASAYRQARDATR